MPTSRSLLALPLLALACGTREPPAPAPAPGPAAEPVAVERPPAATAPAELTPRVRAAHGMLLTLREQALTMVKMDDAGKFSARGCPKDVAWVTWGVAKTDPWDTPFRLRCEPGVEESLHLGSAGPDRAWGTADDLWSDGAPVGGAAACRAGCERATACGGDDRDGRRVREALCADACAGRDAVAHFLVDTCALLEGCETAMGCLDAALDRGSPPWAPCPDLGPTAERALGRPGIAARLVAECEEDVMRAHELVCAASATIPRDLALCFLSVNRRRVEAIAAGG